MLVSVVGGSGVRVFQVEVSIYMVFMWQLVRACMCRDSREQSNVIADVLIPTCVDRDSAEQSETI